MEIEKADMCIVTLPARQYMILSMDRLLEELGGTVSTDSHHASRIALPCPAHRSAGRLCLQSGHAVQPAWYVLSVDRNEQLYRTKRNVNSQNTKKE